MKGPPSLVSILAYDLCWSSSIQTILLFSPHIRSRDWFQNNQKVAEVRRGMALEVGPWQSRAVWEAPGLNRG